MITSITELEAVQAILDEDERAASAAKAARASQYLQARQLAIQFWASRSETAIVSVTRESDGTHSIEKIGGLFAGDAA